ncbi:MAG: Slp family lipoprotein [Gammaproteobacteria bacterium]|jgi:outer membrane lipoprotein|nr:Slp family lipoprotein [Gammaproteobacteria bacterium]
MNRLILIILFPVLFTGCASSPKFDVSGVDRALTPRAAVAEQEIVANRSVLWGGAILKTTNLENDTRLEVLAYPLDGRQRPIRDSDPLGRFIVVYAGYLEPADYTEGRIVTVLGTVGKTVAGKIGETDYTYPLLSPDKVYLWPRERSRALSNIQFGIGVGLGF